MYLRPPSRMLEPTMLGGSPFFTCVPGGEAGDWRVGGHADGQQQGGEGRAASRYLLAGGMRLLDGGAQPRLTCGTCTSCNADAPELCCPSALPCRSSVPSGRVGNSKDAIFRSNEHFREAVADREAQVGCGARQVGGWRRGVAALHPPAAGCVSELESRPGCQPSCPRITGVFFYTLPTVDHAGRV